MMLLPLKLNIIMICFYGVIHGLSSFDRQCPHLSQRRFRIWSECHDNSTLYNCLYSTKNRTYIEFCKNNVKARQGLKIVISGTFRNVRCSEERYQPITFLSNQSSDCLYLKSPCSDTGQITFKNLSTLTDSSCRCDYTRNYAFVSPPRNPCFCVPSVEDCSCYIKQCPYNTTLSPDYQCESSGSKQTNYTCKPDIFMHNNGSEMTTIHKGNDILNVLLILFNI
ncbi:uncharacterized protein [Mytilus edulis]|uniref:uncharacterized protein n=1 Tax=Mytilus edulis TaxID=6550 RepID=UPI0039F14777